MSIYYIFTKDGNIYELDATSDFSVEEIGVPTKFPIEDRSVVSDHYVNYNETFNLTGSISDIKSSQILEDRVKSTEEFIAGIKRIKNNRETFRMVWREDSINGEGDSPTFFSDNCMFTSIKFSQDKTRGYAYGRHSYRVSLTIEKLRIAQQADIIVERANLLAGMTQDKQQGSGTTGDFTDKETGEGRAVGLLDFTFGDFIDATPPGFFYGVFTGRSLSGEVGIE